MTLMHMFWCREIGARHSHGRYVDPRFGGHNIGATRTEEKGKILQYDQSGRALVGTDPDLSTHCSEEPYCMTMLRDPRWWKRWRRLTPFEK